MTKTEILSDICCPVAETESLKQQLDNMSKKLQTLAQELSLLSE